MKLVRALILAGVIICFWSGIIFVATPVHRAIFSIVPADMGLAETARTIIDNNVSKYVLTGNKARIEVLADREQLHMKDVRILWLTVSFLSLLGIGYFGFRIPNKQEYRLALVLLSVVAVSSLIFFSTVFVGLHKIVFTNDYWALSPDQYILTQVYPGDFFLWSWALILGLSGLTIGMLAGLTARRLRLRYNRNA